MKTKAAAFYGFTPVLIPYGLPQDVLTQLLQLANADFLVGAAGSVASDEIQQQCKGIKGIIWVAERSSSEVDFSEPSSNITVWHELVNSASASMSSELPESTTDQPPPGITSIWLGENPKHGELVTFTQSVSELKTGSMILLTKIVEHRSSSSSTTSVHSPCPPHQAERPLSPCRLTHRALRPHSNASSPLLQRLNRSPLCRWARHRASSCSDRGFSYYSRLLSRLTIKAPRCHAFQAHLHSSAFRSSQPDGRPQSWTLPSHGTTE
jgi:hypothetical protein